MTKTIAKKQVSKSAFEKAAKRFADNTAKTAAIIAKSEEKIKAEMASRHAKLGNMPAELEQDEAIMKQYAEDNKATMFNGAKTHDTGLGVVISFRTGMPKLVYNDGVKAEDLLQQLIKRNMMDYVKVSQSLNARVIIEGATENKDLSKVLNRVGVSVEQEETISVKYKES